MQRRAEERVEGAAASVSSGIKKKMNFPRITLWAWAKKETSNSDSILEQQPEEQEKE